MIKTEKKIVLQIFVGINVLKISYLDFIAKKDT